MTQNADNARQADQFSSKAVAVAEQGTAVVSNVIAAMDGINADLQKVTDIVRIIEIIAFQTNSLTLNVGVEAARAGKQGRGLAVVAPQDQRESIVA